MTSLEAFRANIKGDVVTQSDSGYEDAIERWALNAIRRARLVVFVKTTDDIVASLKYAKAVGLPIAIRGGGHSPAGASSVEDGLVIDLSKYFAGAKIDPTNKKAYVQGGALWETVDDAAAEHGLAAVGGGVNHVSVPGRSCAAGGLLTNTFTEP